MIDDHARRLARLERLAWLMDDSIRVPVVNRRIGVDSLIGLVPLAGDVIGGGISAYFLVSALRMGASIPTLLRMALNIAVEMIVGAVPLVGDLFDMTFKANQRNVGLLKRYAGDPARVNRHSRVLLIGALAMVMLVLLGATVLTVYVAIAAVRWLLGLF